MISFLQRRLPNSIRHLIRRLVNTLEEQTSSVQRIGILEARVRYLQALSYALLPEVMPVQEFTQKQIEELLTKHGLPLDIDLRISKNDLMYHGVLDSVLDVQRACFEYICSGMYMFLGIQEIVQHKWGAFANLDTFLDFASGYGRLTRFLIRAMPTERVWVSDIKAGAIEFQRSQFNVHTILSTSAPEQFTLNQRFSCIYVGSLFSHLPQDTFAAWLHRLYSLMAPGGILIFSTLDTSLLSDPVNSFSSKYAHLFQKEAKKVGFMYVPASEEGMFQSVDSPLCFSTYGFTFVSETYIHNLIKRDFEPACRYFRYPRAWGQDIYLLTNDPHIELSGLQIPRNPQGF